MVEFLEIPKLNKEIEEAKDFIKEVNKQIRMNMALSKELCGIDNQPFTEDQINILLKQGITKMAELNFMEDVAIDLDNLHEEWRSHASTRYQYAKEVANLKKELKKHKEKVNVKEAKLIRECKEKNKSFTVQQVNGWVMEHKDFIKIKDELIDIEYDLNMAENSVRAFDDRKHGLENEVVLWCREYFSTPRERRETLPGKFIQGSSIVAEEQRKILKEATRKTRTRR